MLRIPVIRGLRMLGESRGGKAEERGKGIAGQSLSEPAGEVLAEYTVGPVKYILYKSMGLDVRLRVQEPGSPPSSERLRQLLSGLDSPRDEAERYYLEKARSGYGPLYPLVIDPNIEEVAVEGPGRPVAVIHRSVPGVWVTVDLELGEDEADGLVMSLARKAGRSISIAVPMAEGLTHEGYRIAATFGREVSRFGSSVVLRKYPEKPVTIADLVRAGTLSPLVAAYLWVLVEAQSFILITGGMGAGKTTLLQSIANLIPPFHRVLTIEDTPEIRLDLPHWDSLVTRPALPGEQLEPISLEDLLKFALRRRAEYIIVGEVRGREARLLAQAAASGHGSMTTMHASGPEGALLRLQLEPINLPRAFIELIGAIVHLRRVNLGLGGIKRRVAEVTEIDGDEIVTVFRWKPDTDSIEPASPEEVYDASSRLREAATLIPHVTDPVEDLAERASIIERAAQVGGNAIARAVRRFYERRYGGSM